MNIIVSGGSGYIGSFLVKALIDQGHNISIIVRSKKNEFISEFNDSLIIYIADISKPFTFETQRKYDLFIHLAAANDVDSADPGYALQASTLGTRNALDFCSKNHISKFIYFSTFQVYGRVEGDIDEKSILLPTNDYGITHQFAEQYIEMFQRTKQIDYIILRPTNIFGSPMFLSTDRWSLVPTCFCKEAVEKGEINLMSSGRQNRDFLNIHDLVKVTTFYVNNFEQSKNQTINVSSGNNFTILEIAEIVSEIYESIYNKSCRINVHSDNPKAQNLFYICRDIINKSEFKFGSKEEIRNEIKKIFTLLQKNR